MVQFPRNRTWIFVATLCLAVTAIFAACAPNPEAQLISPNMVPVGAGEAFVPPTPTPIPDITMLSPEEIVAGLPDDVVAAFPGDPANGQELSILNGCVGCHQLDPDNQAVAPTWHNMANTAIVRTPDQGPADYLYESIVAPDAYVVSGYNPGIMPQNYEELLTTEQIVDIVSYLLTLEGDE